VAQIEPPVAPHPPDLPAHFDIVHRPAALSLRGSEFQEIALEHADLSGQVAHDLRLERVRLRDVDLTGLAARGWVVRDALVAEGSWSNVEATGAHIARVEATGVRATGVNFADAAIADVVFESCRLDLALFRFAILNRVIFRDCRLDDADFYGARLTSVAFEESSLARASFDAATFTRCEVRGCDLADLQGVGRLGGVRMRLPEVMQIAGLLAESQGIAILHESD